MFITLTQWQAIEAKRDAARKAIRDLEGAIIEVIGETGPDNTQELELLLLLLESVDKSAFELARICTLPQTEWTGGSSTNPKNFTYREPNCVSLVGKFPRRFPKS